MTQETQLDGIRVAQTITALICDVDLRDFEAARRLFTARVHVDYTSLWGGQPTDMTPDALIKGWRGIVPGFDATWHELGAIEVALQRDSAIAQCTVDARHWLDGAVWQPQGRYEFELKKATTWRISLMRLVLEAEQGDRSLVARAQARATAA